MQSSSSPAAWRIAPGYAAFCGLLGVLQPFLPPVLLQRGLSSQSAGLVLGAAALLSSLAPLAASRWLGPRVAPARLTRGFSCAVGGMSLLMAFLATQSVAGWVAAIIFFAAAWSPIAALLDTLAVEATRQGRWQYGHLRVMGSFGFIAASSIIGIWTSDAMGSFIDLSLLTVGLGLAASSFLLPEVALKSSLEAAAVPAARVPGAMWFLLAACCLHWASFGAYQYSYTMLAKGSGLTPGYIGLAWSLGVVSEIFFFFIAARVIRAIGWRSTMVIAFVAAGVRWMALGFFPSATVVVATQLLHGPGFALFYTAAMAAIAGAGGGSLAIMLQGLFTGLVTGLGASVGNSWAGWASARMPLNHIFVYSLPLQLVALGLLLFTRERKKAQ